MKSLITICLLLLLGYNSFAFELQDSTRSRDKSSTTKERERKEGSDSNSSDYYTEEDESVAGSCLSTCLFGFFEGLFSGSGSDDAAIETVTAPYSIDSSSIESETDSVIQYHPDTAAYYTPEEVELTDQYIPEAYPDFRTYLKLAYQTEELMGDGPKSSVEEYEELAYGYRFTFMVFIKGFVINLGFSQGFQNGVPLYDYTTTTVEGGTTTIIKDTPYSTFLSNTSLSMGIGYMINFSPGFGIRLGSGVEYQTFKEETELTRETIVNGTSINTINVTENLTFKELNPFVSIDLFGFPQPDASIMLDVCIQYNFINRDPEYIKSTPLDWNTLIGQFKLNFGIGFNLL